MNVPKLRFKDDNGLDFPEWEEKKIGQLLQVTTGARDTQNKVDNGVYPFFVRSQTVERINSFSYDGEAILTSGDGVGVGKNFHYINGKFDYHQRVYCLSKFNSNALGKYVYFYFSTFFNKRVMRLSAKNSVDSVRMDMIVDMPIYIPTVEEQTKIANFLTAVDDKIAELTKKVALLQRYKKGVMQQIFSQQLRFKDDNGQDFPEWEEKTLGEISNIYDGTHMTPDYQKSGIPFYSVEHITSNNFANTKFIAQEVFERENKRVKLEKGDLLMTKIGDIGTVKYIDWDVEASFYVSLALIKQSEKANFLYVSHYIRTGAFQRELHNRTIHVAFPKKINLGEIGNCIVKLPCEKEQTKIANFLSALDEQINTSQQQLNLSKQYKQSLLQQMFI
ncbi:MAG: restriction endonuclease subunit S [Thiotrichaceae bacterium]|nr:restriction endonuclease subunit S [Thiotrichaceae bacterium]